MIHSHWLRLLRSAGMHFEPCCLKDFLVEAGSHRLKMLVEVLLALVPDTVGYQHWKLVSVQETTLEANEAVVKDCHHSRFHQQSTFDHEQGSWDKELLQHVQTQQGQHH